MGKSLLTILDEMNQDDIKNGTSFFGVSNQVIEANSTQKGTVVKMAGPPNLVLELLSGEKMCVMLIIDKKEYANRIEQSKGK